MSKKGYSKEEREQVGRDLLAVGLEMLSQRGLKGTTLQDILQAVGISKPFFYGNYYTSLAELVIHIINYEITLLLREVQQSVENQDMSLEEIIHYFLDMVTHSRQHHFFVMTQEEEMWVYKHLSPEEFETYQQGQARFYEQVLALWQIPQDKCTPKELGNLILSVYPGSTTRRPGRSRSSSRRNWSGRLRPRQPPFPVIWPPWPTQTNNSTRRIVQTMRRFSMHGDLLFSRCSGIIFFKYYYHCNRN